MWAAIGNAVLKGVVERVLTPDNSSNNSAGSSNRRSQPPQQAYHQNQFNSKPRTIVSTNRNRDSSFCTIKVPTNSNLEIKIKKTQSQMANKNIKVQNSGQTAPGNNNLTGQQKFQTQTSSKYNRDVNKNKDAGLKVHNNVKPRNGPQKVETTKTGRIKARKN